MNRPPSPTAKKKETLRGVSFFIRGMFLLDHEYLAASTTILLDGDVVFPASEFGVGNAYEVQAYIAAVKGIFGCLGAVSLGDKYLVTVSGSGSEHQLVAIHTDNVQVAPYYKVVI